ncbi:MAG: phosphate ABC transporter permease subunit PstC [Chloroflexi bacterium]|nr:phosphate ABC transporter permease subunit PstC [Chloroflexota bacterium]
MTTPTTGGPPGYFPPRELTARDRGRVARERTIEATLFVAAAVGALTTLGILYSLFGETVKFFTHVSIVDFLTDTEWTPLFSTKRFGIWPLVTATMLTSFIALVVAVPVGLTTAVYLSEFATPRVRGIAKPALEVLAGVPTVVYGFFALITITPLLATFIPGMSTFNSLSAGLVMGVMIIPMIASLSEDAMAQVPAGLREGAYALGSTRLEVALRVVFPAALSGIIASVILGLSRAVGETMIVAIAAGQRPIMTLDPRVPVETMTTFIVQVSLGDTPYGSIEYLTIFAVGSSIFVMTLILNVVSHWFVRRFREVYS